MAPNPQVTQRRMEHFGEVLKAEGLKMTSQRIQIFREVAGSEEHPDAETVWKAVQKTMPAVSLDTVYRTLWLFIELDLMTTVGPPRERTRFDANMAPHHHFVCTRCGAALDVFTDAFTGLEVPDAAAELGRVKSVHVEFRGLCRGCSEAEKSGSGARAQSK